MNYAKPKIYMSWSGTKVKLWNWLEGEIGNQNGTFVLNQTYLAEKFGVSRTAVINGLKTFVAANLLRKVDSGRGRGNHSRYKLLWHFQDVKKKNVTPSRVEGTTPRKKITKGRQWRYFAYKFRTLVEKSSLSDSSQVVVGKILSSLEGESPDLFQTWLIYLQNWLDRPRTLRDFFVYLRTTLIGLVKDRLVVEKTREFIEKQVNRKEEVKAEYREDPPPRSKDYARFSDYLDAVKVWEEQKGAAQAH